jgi:hypothetical protein
MPIGVTRPGFKLGRVLFDLRETQSKTDSIRLSVRRGCVDAQLAVRAIRPEPTELAYSLGARHWSRILIVMIENNVSLCIHITERGNPSGGKKRNNLLGTFTRVYGK